MGNNKGTRVLALVMAVVCTLTVAAAVDLASLDHNGDGKVTVWDLQQWLGQENYHDALKQVLGGKGDELNPNKSGAYEIWSEIGLQNMVKNAAKGYTFELKADLDLGGKDWVPIPEFKGEFNGGGHTIQNFRITQMSGNNMGFFGTTKNVDKVDNRTKIADLNLKNVQIIVDGLDDDKNDNSTAKFVGAIVGNNSGDIENCTAEVIVYDKRNLAELNKTYYGTLVGNNAEETIKNADDSVTRKPVGMIRGANTLNTQVNVVDNSAFTQDVISAEYTDAKTVNSKMALFLSDSVDYDTRVKKTAVGIAGFTHTDGIDHSLRWQDITNSTDLAHENLQQRRELAAAEMYKMCTVEWTQNTDMTFYNYEEGTDTEGNLVPVLNGYSYFKAGTVRKGLPYSMGSTNLDCFNAYVGHYTEGTTDPWPGVSYKMSAIPAITQTGFLEKLNVAYVQYTDPTTTEEEKEALVNTYPQLPLMQSTVSAGGVVGFAQYLGTHCASQVAWAWREISAASGEGSVVLPDGCTQMIPSYGQPGSPIQSNNIDDFGIVPVDGLLLPYAGDLDGNGTAYETIDKSIMFSDFYAASRTRLWEALAKVTKGDALVHFSFNGGHVVLALSDAVVIRDWNGAVNTKLSYVITAEQGGDPRVGYATSEDSDGINHYTGTTEDGKVWKSDCCVDRRTTFDDLTENTRSETDSQTTGRDIYHVWIPTSCDVLKNPDSAGATAWCKEENGTITSNFAIISYTVDGDTRYTKVGHNGVFRADMDISLEELTAAFGNMAGKTVTVKLANNQTFDFPY